MIATGEPLPDVALTDTAGRAVALRGLRGEAMLLIFLRHLA